MPGGWGWSGGMSMPGMPSMGWTPYGGMQGMTGGANDAISALVPFLSGTGANKSTANQAMGAMGARPPAASALAAARARPMANPPVRPTQPPNQMAMPYRKGGTRMQAGGMPPVPQNAADIVGRSPFDSPPLARGAVALPPHLQNFPPPAEPGLTDPSDPMFAAAGFRLPKVLPKSPFEPEPAELSWDPLRQSTEVFGKKEQDEPIGRALKESHREYEERRERQSKERRKRRGMTPKKKEHKRGGRAKRALALARKK